MYMSGASKQVFYCPSWSGFNAACACCQRMQRCFPPAHAVGCASCAGPAIVRGAMK
jgi:hypothetical protein